MENLMLTGGNTPFEKAAQRRLESSKKATAMMATTELIRLIAECDNMIGIYKTAMRNFSDDPTQENKTILEEDLGLATQAMKDKRSAEAALLQLMHAAEDLGFVA
tara:strand:- start:329 stop:643 length:315 start_codon:yes stop_codon:yes gene_type:complete